MTKTIEFDYKTGQNTLINGVQDAVNDAIKKIKAKAAAAEGTGGGTGGTGGTGRRCGYYETQIM